MKTLYVLLALISYVMSLKCPVKHFKLPGMVSCHSYLNCSDVKELKIIRELDSGYVKSIYLTEWKQHSVVLTRPKNADFTEDFVSGLSMLERMNPSEFVVQLIGFCRETNTVLTEYHGHGDASGVLRVLVAEGGNTVEGRLGLCVNYAEILRFLHDGPFGRRVACDSNDLQKLLSQFLVTSELRLVLNDVDALPEVVGKGGVVCGTRKLSGEFVAPEQRASNALAAGYNEKTDIWKAASVCQHFLQDHADTQVLLYRTFSVHRKCKSQNPAERPTANDLVQFYRSILKELSSRSEL